MVLGVYQGSGCVLHTREIDKRKPGGNLALQHKLSKCTNLLSHVPLAQATILKRPHTDFAYPWVLLWRHVVVVVIDVVGRLGRRDSDGLALLLLLGAVRVQETPDGLRGRLEAEVAEEERRRGRLLLRGKNLLREFGLALPSRPRVVEGHSGLHRAAFKIAACAVVFLRVVQRNERMRCAHRLLLEGVVLLEATRSSG